MLKAYIILGSFCYIFRENYVLFVVIYTLFQFYALVWFFYVFYRFLDHFTPDLILNKCIWTLHGHPLVAMPVEGTKNRIMWCQSSPQYVCGVGHGPWCLISHETFCFLATFRLLGSFNSIIIRGSSAFMNFTMKRVPLILIFTHPVISFPLFKFLF